MEIIPAIDILDGHVVRLYQGNYDVVTTYNKSPLDLAQQITAEGFEHLHIIDLEGARTGKPHILETMTHISPSIKFQVGGGVRDVQTAQSYLNTNAKRIILGSKAITDLNFLQTCIATFGADRIMLSLDIKNNTICIDGWKKTTDYDLNSFLTIIQDYSLQHLIITDIQRDGVMQGVNVDLYENIIKRYPSIKLYAAGGISSLAEIIQLKKIGVTGSIIGKSFYENKQFRTALSRFVAFEKINGNFTEINWEKVAGLLPVIVQSADDGSVLMLGYMNETALIKTLEIGTVHFYSRTKQRLWEKGESSGNYLHVAQMNLDCDKDTLLVTAHPTGPVCHQGTPNCFNVTNENFLCHLETIIKQRVQQNNQDSYVCRLMTKGKSHIAQKVGEEAVEFVIASIENDTTQFLEEGADLLFHYLVNLYAHGFSINDIVKVLEKRHKSPHVMKGSHAHN